MFYYLETIAIVFSILYVFLAAKQVVWCWIAAMISVIIYMYICYHSKLYMETGLQVFYFFMSIYGFWNWSANKNRQNPNMSLKKGISISEWSIHKHLITILVGTVAAFFLGFIFSTYTDAEMPIIDSFTTVFSIFATFMVAKKILGNWLYWIVIDIASVYLYDSRDLKQTAFLFIVYTAFAIYGYFSWIKKMEAYD
tara:strand:+ start:116 stop:703 length:588 start_codon:yes stop_codon:yes gene_type:complete